MATIPPVLAIVERCQALFDDLDFNAVKQWKAEVPGRKAIGYMPIYVPRELIHAAGMLPVGIMGGGDQLEVIQGDAYYQSYICRIPRSTIELGLTGRAMVYLPEDLASPERARFWLLHNAYLSVEALKLGLGLILGAVVMNPKRSGDPLNQFNMVDKANHRHVNW